MSSKILYLGTSPEHFPYKEKLLHYPVIKLIPASIEDCQVRFCLDRLEAFTCCFFTSKNAVEILVSLCKKSFLDPEVLLKNKCISIGPSTSLALEAHGVIPLLEAAESTQEGMIDLCEKQTFDQSYVFYPRSSLARPLLGEYLSKKASQLQVLDLYNTEHQIPLPIPSLDDVEEIVFTSPSTVDGFFKIFSSIPSGKKISFQGPITKQRFHELGGPI